MQLAQLFQVIIYHSTRRRPSLYPRGRQAQRIMGRLYTRVCPFRSSVKTCGQTESSQLNTPSPAVHSTDDLPKSASLKSDKIAYKRVNTPKWLQMGSSTTYRTNNRIGALLFDSWICCSSWGRSRHTGHIDIALNYSCRISTRCLKATPIPWLCALAGIAPSHIHRKVASNADRCLQEDDPRHPLHGERPVKHRLPSRNSFIDSTEALNTWNQDVRTTLWVEEWNALGERSTEWRDRGIILNEHVASGTD